MEVGGRVAEEERERMARCDCLVCEERGEEGGTGGSGEVVGEGSVEGLGVFSGTF